MKKIANKVLDKSLDVGKKIINKNPKVKKVIKNKIDRYIPVKGSSLAVRLIREISYKEYLINNYPDNLTLLSQKKAVLNFRQRPKISIVTPVYNTSAELLEECINSVLTQSYDNWELCLVNDASTNSDIVDKCTKYAFQDSRIKFKNRTSNGHISRASNDGIKIATGDFIGLLDHDDFLWPNALFEVVKLINDKPETDFIYTDEDKITKNRLDHKFPFFKPDWNPEFLESVNYITHFSVIRRTIIDKIGGFRLGVEGAQDWDLFLRVSELTDKIEHIPKVLYSWRMIESSTASSTNTKPYVVKAQRKALEDHFERSGLQVKLRDGVIKDYWWTKYIDKNKPLVSIVIPTKDQFRVVKRCVESIFSKTTYENFEIVIVDTGSQDKKVYNWYAALQSKYKNIKIVEWHEAPFSYSRSCNRGAAESSGEYLVMLNNDTEIKTGEWIETLLSDAHRKDIGAVGCKLFYPNGIHIQHAGVGIGIGGLAANKLSMVPNNDLNQIQHLYANTRHAETAVTAACLMIDKKKFDEVGGFDEKFRVTYNDVDLCLKLDNKGYRNIYTPHVRILHHESISVGRPEHKSRDSTELIEAKKLFRKRWATYIEYDPNLNPNFDRKSASLELPYDLS